MKIGRLFKFVLFLFTLFSTFAFSYTNTFADFYGLALTDTSPAISKILENTDQIDLFKRLIGIYTFETNANPRNPSVLTSGFTMYKSILSFIPDKIIYDTLGVNYDIWVKLLGVRIGNSISETIFSFGGAFGINFESLSLLTGNSHDYNDFNKVELRHYNVVSTINLIGSIKFRVDIPVNSNNFPFISYIASYDIGTTIYGPYLPDFKIMENIEFERTFSRMSHTILLRVRF
ncbi:hypothetical protein [Fervidobacterium nodosum]|uniref:Outer membrane protein beta-barrel domain-containing protein n=1 Tax=Fervidobacterium nodosum (strain ATCC 35602 / DSM 5306 / Rt17-B1) TaxID=381764 RepID=A7HNE5_FERNB|nr:hypothetical protein [Fervidobacterium nodosum]ABS61428.1 hypothetical protein Fnod_1585 [Fervidobacterium nodosum Rt17-B1]